MNKQVYILFQQKRRIKSAGNIEATMSRRLLPRTGSSPVQIDLIVCWV